jgi:hypothetical protein
MNSANISSAARQAERRRTVGVMSEMLVAGDPEVRVAELTLDHNERDTLVRHLDRVRVPKLVWSKATPDTSCEGCVMQLLARG